MKARVIILAAVGAAAAIVPVVEELQATADAEPVASDPVPSDAAPDPAPTPSTDDGTASARGVNFRPGPAPGTAVAVVVVPLPAGCAELLFRNTAERIWALDAGADRCLAAAVRALKTAASVDAPPPSSRSRRRPPATCPDKTPDGLPRITGEV